jgi:hypothetical protein
MVCFALLGCLDVGGVGRVRYGWLWEAYMWDLDIHVLPSVRCNHFFVGSWFDVKFMYLPSCPLVVPSDAILEIRLWSRRDVSWMEDYRVSIQFALSRRFVAQALQPETPIDALAPVLKSLLGTPTKMLRRPCDAEMRW